MGENLKEDIKQAKKELVKKASEKGLWENFGQKKVRELKDKYDGESFDGVSGYELIKQFDEWCMQLDLSELEKYKEALEENKLEEVL